VETHGVGTVGILANPMAGRDVRRLIGRALQQTPDMKRNQIQRAVVGAVAAGARRVLLMRDVFRAAESAIESLRLHADVALLDGPIETNAGDTRRNALALRDAGCGALIVLGGDGTNRQVALAWPDAPLIPLSTGTNNVFPEMLEATSAGAAAGLVAAGAVSIDEVSRRCKVVEVEYPNSETDLALVDVALLEGDHPGSLLAFDPTQLRDLVLTRAEPAAVGMSPIGGLLQPVGRDDPGGITVRCTAPDAGGRPLLVPISPGLYRTAYVAHVAPLEEGVWTQVSGPGVVATDGDRMRMLGPRETARARVMRRGPRVIDVPRTLTLAAKRGIFRERPPHLPCICCLSCFRAASRRCFPRTARNGTASPAICASASLETPRDEESPATIRAPAHAGETSGEARARSLDIAVHDRLALVLIGGGGGLLCQARDVAFDCSDRQPESRTRYAHAISMLREKPLDHCIRKISHGVPPSIW